MNPFARRQLRIVSVLLAGSLILGLAAPGLGGTTIKLEPPDGKAVAEPTPVTFGIVFRPGEIAKGKTVKAKLGDADIAVQLDAKRSYEDGSLKHGVVSLIVPKLDAAAALEFTAADPVGEKVSVGEVAKKLLAGDFDATVSFVFPAINSTQPDAGVAATTFKPVSASARKMLEAAGDKVRPAGRCRRQGRPGFGGTVPGPLLSNHRSDAGLRRRREVLGRARRVRRRIDL